MMDMWYIISSFFVFTLHRYLPYRSSFVGCIFDLVFTVITVYYSVFHVKYINGNEHRYTDIY